MQDAVSSDKNYKLGVEKSRQSNIELLRIIAMLLIIAGHFIGQSQILNHVDNINGFYLSIIGRAARIATNIFLLIGTWFMVDSTYKSSKVWKLYGEVAVYTISITLIMAIINENITIQQFVRGLLPFLGYPVWFASAYIMLLLLSPFLKKILQWDMKILGKFVFFLFILISVISTLSSQQVAYVADCCWFIFVYLFMGYFKRLNIDLKKYKWILLVTGLFIYFGLVITEYLCIRYGANYKILSIGTFLSQKYLSDLKTIPNFLAAFCIFGFFTSIDLKTNKTINFIASTTFGVYIIHQVPAFIDFLWHKIFFCDLWINSKFVFIYTIITIVLVYVMASIIDICRKKLLEPLWIKSRLYKYLCQKLDDFIGIT